MTGYCGFADITIKSHLPSISAVIHRGKNGRIQENGKDANKKGLDGVVGRVASSTNPHRLRLYFLS